MTVVQAPDDAPAAVPPEQRGTLTIKPRVVSRLAMRSLRASTAAESDPEVNVTYFGEDHVELAARVTVPYPDEPIGAVLDRVRGQVAQEVATAVGRPVRTIDLTVEKFHTPSKPRRVL